MDLISKLLQNKPLSEWQQSVIETGRNCPQCGFQADITAPISDNEEMIRCSCGNCGNLWYEFPKEAKIINFEDIRTNQAR